MLEYSQLLNAFDQAQQLVYIYDSDVHIEILKHTYPFVICMSYLNESHTFCIMRMCNLKFFKRKLDAILCTL